MLKKIVITLFVLIMIAVIGIVSLIVFVDPNNFRGFISQTVKSKTGYELTIEGDLRWHIWPQISILTDSIKLSDQGAAKPILTADNMRLDVELTPLFSKHLSIKNVLIKSAVINVTDDSQGQIAKGLDSRTTTVNNTQSQSLPAKHEPSNKASSWSLMFNKLVVADSTVVWQKNKDFINFRNIDITLEQKSDKHVDVSLSGNMNRDQQDLIANVNANVDLAQFPEKAVIQLNNVDYDYKGVGVPSGQMKGSITGTVDYQRSPLMLSSRDLAFSINENNFSGSVSVNLDNKANINLALKTDNIDITPFLNDQQKSTEKVAIQQTTPVVTTVKTASNQLDFLNDFNAKISFNADQMRINKIVLSRLNMDAQNQDGVTTFKNLSFDMNGGQIKATGSANGKQKVTQVKLNTQIANVNLGSLFSDLEIKNDLKGAFNATGDLSTNTLTSSDLLGALQGKLAVVVTGVRLENINIPNIIQTTVSQYTKDILSAENQQKYTEFHQLSANANLNKGNMELTSLKANSATLDVDGTGRVGMVDRDLDVDLQVKMLGGWNGKSETIAKLQQVTIPLRIYGQFASLHYQIQAEKLIKDLLGDKLQQQLDKLKDRFQRGESNRELATDSKSKTKSKAVDILGGLVDKIEKK